MSGFRVEIGRSFFLAISAVLSRFKLQGRAAEMKFTLSWLKDHLETAASADEVAEALTDSGLELESLTNPADKFAAFTICRVVEAKKHPNADRLQVCTLETFPDGPGGRAEQIQVVCGAPNARTGLVGVFAPVGTHIPGTGIDLASGEIRGVVSNGMLCSERELMISDDHEGIIDLPDDAELGAKFADYRGLNDPVFDIAVTPNRPDALGVRGIALDLEARRIGKLKPPQVRKIKGAFQSGIKVAIDEELKPKACPAFFGRLVRGVRNGSSPEWIRRRLEAVGLRPISALVDITNYVMLDRNRPLHAFDADKVVGGLRVHFAEGGEKLVALDGETYEFEKGMVAISDDRGIESVAGIMGGESTGCTDETVNVFVESALWDPVATAKTGRKLNVESDARYRFERGVDPAYALEGLDLAIGMILDCCGGEPSEIAGDGAIPDVSRQSSLRLARVESLTGMKVSAERQVEILESLGFRTELGKDRIVVSVPSWRPDIEGEADLVEEVARIASLSKLKGAPLRRVDKGVARPVLTPLQNRERAARRAIASLGYNECVTYSFIDDGLARQFCGADDLVRLENPISTAMNVMRPDLLPCLLAAAARNQARGSPDLALFEVGPVFQGGKPGEERLNATGLLVGDSAARSPHARSRAVDLFDAKADVEAVLSAIGVSAKALTRDAAPYWHPGRSGRLRDASGSVAAEFGEINPRVLKATKIKGIAIGFTVHLDGNEIAVGRNFARSALELPELQVVERDFSFVLDEGVEAEEVLRAAESSEFSKHFEKVAVFDEFSGPKAEEQFGKGKKSLAFSVRLQPRERSFKVEQLEEICADIVKKVSDRVGGQLR